MGTPEVMGPYVIYERLGAGGMATVHRAEQIGLAGFRKQVALKRLLPHIASDPKMLKMFTHEARLASHLRHGNVAQIYDLGKHDETYFIAMEYVAGPTLTQIMKQCAVAAGAMPIGIVLSILAQVCDALDHAHNLSDDTGRPLGIIHRDISPGNIIVSSTGVVKLIDFGIAKVSDAGEVQTQAGYIKGKYAYIAPEYTLGHLDLRADLFGLGVIAHELLASRRLFNAPTDFETIQRLREMPIQPPSRWNAKVPQDVDDIVLTALQRDPELRWQSAAAMRTAIHNAARTTDNLVTNTQLAEWVERTFAVQRPSTALGHALDTLDDATDARGRPVDDDDPDLDEDDDADDDVDDVGAIDDDADTIAPASLRAPESTRAPTRSLAPRSRQFAAEGPTTVASPAYVEAVARATPAPRTSTHVVRRDAEPRLVEPPAEPRPTPPPIRPYKHASSPPPLPTQVDVVAAAAAAGAPPAPVTAAPAPLPTLIDPPPPTSLPLGAPAAILPTLVDLVLIPEPAPDNRAIALSLPPDQARAAQVAADAKDAATEAARAAEDAQRAASAAATFPASEDSGVVVGTAPVASAEQAEPAPRRRIWPWLLLALLVIAACVAWYLYFIEGFEPDLGL